MPRNIRCLRALMLPGAKTPSAFRGRRETKTKIKKRPPRAEGGLETSSILFFAAGALTYFNIQTCARISIAHMAKEKGRPGAIASGERYIRKQQTHLPAKKQRISQTNITQTKTTTDRKTGASYSERFPPSSPKHKTNGRGNKHRKTNARPDRKPSSEKTRS